MTALDPALIDRFRADFVALAGEPDRLGVALSGGPDSLALLLLAAAAWPGQVAAATVDHGLRPESAAEAALAAAQCLTIGVPHDVLKVAVPDGPDGIQAEARKARYAALKDWAAANGIAIIATAHHADDQAETMLMRLRRGAGLSGLSGIRSVRIDGALQIVRPLLSIRKAELSSLAGASGVDMVDDPSNRDPLFDRSGLRAFLAQDTLFDPIRLARSAAALAEAEAALDWSAHRLWDARAHRSGDAITIMVEGVPAELRRRLLVRALATLAPDRQLRGNDVSRLLATLEADGTATLAEIRCEGGVCWRLAPAPPRRATARED